MLGYILFDWLLFLFALFWFVYSSSVEFITPADITITDEGLILRFFSVLWQVVFTPTCSGTVTIYNILIAFMVSFDNYYLTYKVILKCFLDFASVFLYHEQLSYFPVTECIAWFPGTAMLRVTRARWTTNRFRAKSAQILCTCVENLRSVVSAV